MWRYLNSWLQRLKSLVWYSAQRSTTANEQYSLPLLDEASVEKEPSQTKKQKQDTGSFYHLGTLLDDLDRYFKSLRLFKRHDSASYALFSKIGAPLVGRDTGLLFAPTDAKLEPYWHRHRPAFGAVFLGGSKEEKADWCGVDLVYFKKFNNRHEVTVIPNSRAELYEVGVFYKQAKKDFAYATYFFVYVSDDGEMFPAPMKKSEAIRLPKKGGVIHRSVWQHGLPDALLTDWRKHEGQEHATAADVAKCFFALAANYTVLSAGGLQIRAKRGSAVALFNIDMLRTPYFFKDRERTVTVNGNSKKIFHIVRTHKRRLKNGTERFVKTHFRGERKFTWNGHEITITMPGKHHTPLQEFNGPLYVQGDLDIPEANDRIDLDETAVKIAAHMDR
jgi:hypothetical protein